MFIFIHGYTSLNQMYFYVMRALLFTLQLTPDCHRGYFYFCFSLSLSQQFSLSSLLPQMIKADELWQASSNMVCLSWPLSNHACSGSPSWFSSGCKNCFEVPVVVMYLALRLENRTSLLYKAVTRNMYSACTLQIVLTKHWGKTRNCGFQS